MESRFGNMDLNWPRSNPLDSRLNMYERQIDQLFEHNYQSQDDIKSLFKRNDDLINRLDTIEKYNDINELKLCIQNYYQLELENKKRMLNHECYQFQLFIVQLFIICYFVYLRFE